MSAMRKPTIYEALAAKLHRAPTNAELKADVERIKRDAVVSVASKGRLPHQRRNVTDRALRYRANATPPPGPRRCCLCGNPKERAEVGHVNGHEEDSSPRNLFWTCRSCNVKAANTMRKAGVGRLTRQYNPAGGAETLGAWMNAIASIKGEGGTMAVPEAVAMIHATPPEDRSMFAREIWGKRRERGTDRARKPNFSLFGGSKVTSSSKLSQDAFNAGYKGQGGIRSTTGFNDWYGSLPAAEVKTHHGSMKGKLRSEYERGVRQEHADHLKGVKSKVADLRAEKRSSAKPPPLPPEAKVKTIEHNGLTIRQTVHGFEVKGETWNTLKQAKEYADYWVASGGKIRRRTNMKKKRNAGDYSRVSAGNHKRRKRNGSDSGGVYNVVDPRDGASILGDFTTKEAAQAALKTAKTLAAYKRTKLSVRRKNGSDSSVRSPTRTSSDVRSPTSTKTATKADTRGNITVTGGAGAGATTSVTVNRKNGKRRKNPELKRGDYVNVPHGRFKVEDVLPGGSYRLKDQHGNSSVYSAAAFAKLKAEGPKRPVTPQVKWNPSKRNSYAHPKGTGEYELTQGKSKAQIFEVGSGKHTAQVIPASGTREEHTFSGPGSFKAATSWARLRLHEVANPKGSRYKVYALGNRRKNPADPAARMYEKFHGTPSAEVREYVEEVHRHSWLAGLGPVISIKVRSINGNREAELEFPDPEDASVGDVVMLCTTEDGTQLICTGGDQELDPKSLLGNFGMTQSDFQRDNVLVGTIVEITYRTKKSFEKNGEEEIDFFHVLGKEGSKGVYPVLVYHPRNPSLEIVGGRYYIGKAEKSLGNVSPGIIG